MKGSLFFFSILWLNASVQSNIYTCDPKTDCGNIGVAGTVVPDPENCEKYYLCISNNGEIVNATNSVRCGDGLYFDQGIGGCSQEHKPGICGPNVCPVNICSTECPTPFAGIVYAADKKSCNSFYICLSVGPIQQNCTSATPYFSGTSCVADASQCCNFCTAHCSSSPTQIVDPCDCTSYYLCLAIGIPSEDFRFSCAAGSYYDETIGKCMQGKCTSICPSCGEQTTPSTSSTASGETTVSTTSILTTASTSSISKTESSASIATTKSTTSSVTTESTTSISITASTSSIPTTESTTYIPTTESTTSITTTKSTTTIPTTESTTSIPITTSTTSIITTSTTTLPTGCSCATSFTCPGDGNYPQCNCCNINYFSCVGGIATLLTCPENTIFNTNAEFPYCLDPKRCPYP